MKDGKLDHKYKFKILGLYFLLIVMLLGWMGLSICFAFWVLSFGNANGKLLIAAFLPILYSLIALAVFLVYKPSVTKGIILNRTNSPGLFDIIDNTAREIGYRGYIEECVLTAGTSVAVSYTPNLYNLIFDSKVSLRIGVAILRVLSVDELKAVIAHELAHYAQPQTKYKAYLARISNIALRLGGTKKKGASSEDRTIAFGIYAWPAQLFQYCFSHIFGLLFDLQSNEYYRLTAEMEIEADAIAAQQFGKENLLSSLLKSDALSQRLHLYKSLILPSVSGLGYRCNSFLQTFDNSQPLFHAIDGLEINPTQNLSYIRISPSEILNPMLAIRINALESIVGEPQSHQSTKSNLQAVDLLPKLILTKIDNILCRKYGQAEGVEIGIIRFAELLYNLQIGLFVDVHTMKEAFAVLGDLYEEVFERGDDVKQIILPPHTSPSCDVVPQPFIRQPSEFIFTSNVDNCPVCGSMVEAETKICPHCHEVILE